MCIRDSSWAEKTDTVYPVELAGKTYNARLYKLAVTEMCIRDRATTALATGWIAKLRGVGGIDFAYIGKVLLFLAGMYLLSAAFSFIQGLSLIHI